MKQETNPLLVEIARLASSGRFKVNVGRPRELEPSLYEFAFQFPDGAVEKYQVRGSTQQIAQWWNEVFQRQVEQRQFASDMDRITRNDD